MALSKKENKHHQHFRIIRKTSKCCCCILFTTITTKIEKMQVLQDMEKQKDKEISDSIHQFLSY